MLDTIIPLIILIRTITFIRTIDVYKRQVHVGFAMSRIDAEEARKTLELLHELGEAQKEIESMTRPVG